MVFVELQMAGLLPICTIVIDIVIAQGVAQGSPLGPLLFL